MRRRPARTAARQRLGGLAPAACGDTLPVLAAAGPLPDLDILATSARRPRRQIAEGRS